jgi:hypothetical protein
MALSAMCCCCCCRRCHCCCCRCEFGQLIQPMLPHPLSA